MLGQVSGNTAPPSPQTSSSSTPPDHFLLFPPMSTLHRLVSQGSRPGGNPVGHEACPSRFLHRGDRATQPPSAPASGSGGARSPAARPRSDASDSIAVAVFLLPALASCSPQAAGPLGTRETPTQTRMCASSTWDPKKSTVRTARTHRESSRAGRRRGAALDRRTCSLDTPVPILSALRRSLRWLLRVWAPLPGPGQPRVLVSGQDTHGHRQEKRPVRDPAGQGEQGGFESGSWLLK